MDNDFCALTEFGGLRHVGARRVCARRSSIVEQAAESMESTLVDGFHNSARTDLAYSLGHRETVGAHTFIEFWSNRFTCYSLWPTFAVLQALNCLNWIKAHAIGGSGATTIAGFLLFVIWVAFDRNMHFRPK